MKASRITVIVVSLLVLLMLSLSQVAGENPCGEPPSFYVIERDTLQSRNFTPIINHHTMVVNLGKCPANLQLISRFPSNKFREGKFYPAFLEDSLLPDPLFAPFDISPRKVSYAPRPKFLREGNTLIYKWEKVTLPGQEALIAQYDNYFGEPSLFWRSEGLEIEGLKLKSSYRIEPTDSPARSFILKYDIKNLTVQKIENLIIQVFLPIKVITERDEVHLLDLTKICTSPNAEFSLVTRSDGFMRSAYGINVTSRIGDLTPGESWQFFFGIEGELRTNSETIWPIFHISGRSHRKAIWPPTELITDQHIQEQRFSYLSYNLILRDSRTFVIDRQKILVKPAK